MDALSTVFADLHLLRPAWLWGMLALPVLGWWWRRRRVQASAWRSAVDPHLLPHLIDAGGGRRGWLAPVVAAVAYAIGVLALAGPSWEQVAQPAWRAPSPLLVALDLSSATAASDLPPSRLLQARAKLAALLEARSDGQVGLVAYAGDAFTAATAPPRRKASNASSISGSSSQKPPSCQWRSRAPPGSPSVPAIRGSSTPSACRSASPGARVA